MELLGSPGRTLVSIVLFNLTVIVLATMGYMAAGWSFADASYMVLLTIYTVGYPTSSAAKLSMRNVTLPQHRNSERKLPPNQFLGPRAM